MDYIQREDSGPKDVTGIIKQNKTYSELVCLYLNARSLIGKFDLIVYSLGALTLYLVLWMSRSISEINARCLKFVKTCINVIIIMVFYTNCTCGLAKTNLGYT